MNASSFFTASPATLRPPGPPPLRSSAAYKLLVATARTEVGAGGIQAPCAAWLRRQRCKAIAQRLCSGSILSLAQP